jgi:RNA polymerase sigma factor (sigma-70 family)
MTSDLELLKDYVQGKSEESFTALVNRHMNLVYSAAIRQVRSPQLAEEVVQSAFIDLARQADGLAPNTVLTAWLYKVTRRTALNTLRRETRRQIREQVAFEVTAMNAPCNDWSKVESILDEAMHTLDEPDRTAILLRYFENKSLREVGRVIGASENAAQKRISRAVERLREFLAKRGVAVGASGLVLAISVNAVEAAPVGLTATVSAAALLSGTTLAGATAAGFTKAIVMTTLQKTLIATTLVVVTGTGIFEAHKASKLEAQIEVLQQRLPAPSAEQFQQLEQERDEAIRQLTALRSETAPMHSNQTGSEGAPNFLTPSTATAATRGASPEKIGRELGKAVVRGDPSALGKLSELAKAELASFNTNSIGLNDTQRSDLARQTFAPLHAAFKVIEEDAVANNELAINAVAQATQFPELKGGAIQCIGAIAGAGNDAALGILLDPRKYDLAASSVVAALEPAADNGNQKAIDALASVASDSSQSPFWFLAATGLEKSAGSGNPAAIDALIAMSTTTNISVRNAIVPALKIAASNQNAQALDALRSMGVDYQTTASR